MYIYLNGRILKEQEALISIFDHGFMYGLGLFETFRVYQGHSFLFYDHLSRLRQGLEELNINWGVTDDQLLQSIQELLDQNHLQDAYIRLNVSAGPSTLGLTTETYQNPTSIMYIKPIPELVKEKEGVFLETPRNTPEGRNRLKSHHYLNNIFGKREIGQAPGKEGIFLTKEGNIAEGIVSNLFWVKNNVVYTPHVDTGILNGITRQFVLKLLEKETISYVEGFFNQSDFLESDEAFITNSIQEIIPIYKVEQHQFLGSKGPVTNYLQQQYHNYTSTLLTMNQDGGLI
jgi:4-amino-4-deoxychorismate lyase